MNSLMSRRSYSWATPRRDAIPIRLIATILLAAFGVQSPAVHAAPARPADELLRLDNGVMQVGIDRAKGASITWLSWAAYPQNMVNSADPGRLIQQSYYAGRHLNRQTDGQHKSWSPWTWNPIQGGGVGSWARVNQFKRVGDHTLYGETIPKLWDMHDEEAAAVMRQWTGFEPGMSNVVVVRCEFTAQRNLNDRWGPAAIRPQEVPACYFTRNFNRFKSYLGEGRWRMETQRPGPPWGKASPEKPAMACFAKNGQGVAIFSPSARHWNFGPHAGGNSDDPSAGPCVHIAPITQVNLGPKTTLRYSYWLIVGNEKQLSTRLDTLIEKYSNERIEVTNP
jgi:hypothetical protein